MKKKKQNHFYANTNDYNACKRVRENQFHGHSIIII